MGKDYLRGYEIKEVDGEWVFADNNVPTVHDWQRRPCGNCGSFNTPEGHDACLGTLRGVMNACCGHGRAEDAYVQFLDGHTVHGSGASLIMGVLKESD